MKKTHSYIVAVFMLFGMSSANAALVDFTLIGNVETADAGNIFSLSAGNTITATGSIDDSLLAGGTSGLITNLLITAGDLTFNESMDLFGEAWIRLTANGDLYALTYQAEEDQLGSLARFHSSFDSFLGSSISTTPDEFGLYPTLGITGHWDVSSFTATVVPVPAAVWLFGSGLLGLVGVARRKKV